MRDPLREQVLSAEGGQFTWQQERVLLEVSELACELLEEEGLSRVDLADRLGKGRSFVTQILQGTRNLTLRTMSDIFTALGYAFHPSVKRIDSVGSPVRTCIIEDSVAKPFKLTTTGITPLQSNCPTDLDDDSPRLAASMKFKDISAFAGAC